MKHRGVPPINPADLQDVADAGRVERIWERIESALPAHGASSSPARRWPVALLAAASLAFAGGVLSGKLLWQGKGAAEAPSVVRSADEQPTLDVLAAGTQGRAFALPGGGHMLLGPGATMEIVRNPDGTVSLRLVQGEATVDAVQLSQPLSIFAGDAMLSMQAGSAARMRRSPDDTIDVSVSDGTVHILSPSGPQRLDRGQHAEAIPIRTAVSSVEPSPRLRHMPFLAPHHRDQVSVDPSKLPVSTSPDWLTQNNSGNTSEALRLLKSQPDGIRGAIRSARSARELMDIHDVAMSSPDAADKALATEALRRVVESFPDSGYAQIAAYKLGMYYQRTNPAESRLWLQRAQAMRGPLTEDALCRRFKAAQGEEAVRLAKEYIERYPEGRCKEEAERVAAGETAQDEDEPATPDAGADAKN
jgi:hypothetical protein